MQIDFAAELRSDFRAERAGKAYCKWGGFADFICSSGLTGHSNLGDSLAVLTHGIFGAGSVVTGLLLACPVTLLVALGEGHVVGSFNLCDGLFVAFMVTVGVSLFINGHGSDLEELALLVITLGGYLARRLCGERETRRRDDYQVRGDGGRRAGDVGCLSRAVVGNGEMRIGIYRLESRSLEDREDPVIGCRILAVLLAEGFMATIPES
ncbi:hypothetical protein A5906_08245 [Bradyrhizobium sacchari]|uniref:Uncharacterized protein n=1 Tax=Bradyrhizobium sacchari TaxID=1399419 RepID=A0A560JA64_9BRAD|nr:hypothetical protein [Bradyrhizobium sacchari]OPY95460.1 hypothetical protein A5906_08245 [Bradyrhizobium sacchari]TWB48736.1 hypothetical protein FBZ94_11418 [Bradyrhizobium sacchari]TWB67897.1 hypothetical protein FBZ95_11318 [Bradyrhizobium sacchari]